LANLITAENVYARISKARVDRCLNDSGSGEASQDAMETLLEDVTSWLRGNIGPVADLSVLDEQSAGDLRRIGVDRFKAYLCERAPEVMRQDAKAIFDRTDREIKKIRIGEASLGTEQPPEPLENNDARISSGNPNDTTRIPTRFSDDWGDFG